MDPDDVNDIAKKLNEDGMELVVLLGFWPFCALQLLTNQ